MGLGSARGSTAAYTRWESTRHGRTLARKLGNYDLGRCAQAYITVARTVLHALARMLGWVMSGCCCIPLRAHLAHDRCLAHNTAHARGPLAVASRRAIHHTNAAHAGHACTSSRYNVLALLQLPHTWYTSSGRTSCLSLLLHLAPLLLFWLQASWPPNGHSPLSRSDLFGHAPPPPAYWR